MSILRALSTVVLRGERDLNLRPTRTLEPTLLHDIGLVGLLGDCTLILFLSTACIVKQAFKIATIEGNLAGKAISRNA